MQINKKHLSITALVALSTLIAQGSSLYQTPERKLTLDYSAIINFSRNLESLRSDSGVVAKAEDELDKTQEIVGVIEKEIEGGNRQSLLALGIKTKSEKVIARTPKVKIEIEEVKTKLAQLEINNQQIELKKFSAPAPSEIVKLESLKIQFPKDKVVAMSTQGTVETQGLEINTSELIKSPPFSKGIAPIIKFSDIAIEESYGKDVKDEVEVGQSATLKKTNTKSHSDEVKTIQHSIIKDEGADDLQLYEYSGDEKAEYSPKGISETVKNAIQREMGSQKNKKQQPKKSEVKEILGDIDLDSPENIVYDYSTNSQAESVSTPSAFETSALTNSQMISLKLRTIEVNLATGRIKTAVNSEFVSDYDRAEIIGESAPGEISAEYSVLPGMNTHTGVVRAEGVVPTRIEINIGNDKSMNIPLVSENGLESFFKSQGQIKDGNLMMFSISPEVIDVEVDTKTTQKIFFNKDLKILNGRIGADYVLLTGIKTGNVLVSYLLEKGEKAQKVVYVGEGEMYFEHADITSGSRVTVGLMSRNIMGQVQKGLSLDPEKLMFFATNITAKKKALSAYEFKLPSMAQGMRKYIELKNFKEPVFVGFYDQKQLEIPTREFIELVLEKNKISELADRCLVQINFSKDIKELKVAGKNRTGEMDTQLIYLDKDGNFSEEGPEYSEKAFILGDLEGIINAKIEYNGGGAEYLKTFCSEGSYIIEQL
jgi:hypothetical protein